MSVEGERDYKVLRESLNGDWVTPEREVVMGWLIAMGLESVSIV